MKILHATVVLSILVACVLTGCAPTSNEIKPQDISDFRPGVTTQREVVARLGTPSSMSTLPDGSTFLVYSFTQPQSAASSWIQAIGPYQDTGNVNSSTISFQFGPNGLLSSSNTVSSRFGPQAPGKQ